MVTLPCDLSCTDESYFSVLLVNSSENLPIKVLKNYFEVIKTEKKNALKYATNVLTKQQIPLNIFLIMISNIIIQKSGKN